MKNFLFGSLPPFVDLPHDLGQIRRHIDRDKRYEAVKSSSLREDLFEEFVKELSEASREKR